MTNITQYIPKESPIVSAIYASHKERGDAEPSRGYLGASIIGHSCSRYLWYTFRACVKRDFPGRMYRLFETGDLEEIRMVKDLRDIGCEVHEHEPVSFSDPGYGIVKPKQFEITDIGGHFSGHMDGCALGIPGAEKTWHVLEFKTHNAKSFAKLKKEGVQKSKPIHYAQMQVYMYKTGMKRALYLAKHKDTDELYAERVKCAKIHAVGLILKAKRIVFATEPPERITSRQDWWECRFCDAHELCWGSDSVALPISSINCRQCCHATPTTDGHAHWVCEKHKRALTPKDQAAGDCQDHLVLPGLISFAKPTGFGKDLNEHESIVFENSSGGAWRHGRGEGCFSSNELCVLPASALINPTVASAKELFGAEATGSSADDILSRYPEEDSRIIWKGRDKNLITAWKELYREDLIKLTPILSKCDGIDYKAVEFDGGRVAIVWLDSHEAEIREGVE